MGRTRRKEPKTHETAVCFRCGSDELVEVAAKCNDLCRLTRSGKTEWGYVPDDIGLGDNADYVEFTYCRTCGQMQNAEFQAK